MTNRRDDSGRVDRRTLLKTAGVGVAGSGLLGTASGSADGAVEPSVTFEDQASDGTSIVVAEVATDVEALLTIRDADRNRIGGHPPGFRFEPGETREEITVELKESISETQELVASLTESNGPEIARDRALVTLDGEPPERIDGFDPQLVEADPDAGFNYPYFLYAPDKFAGDDPSPTLVEPNNTGTATDDFAMHRDRARNAVESGFTRRLSDELDAPLVMPVFPRPQSEPVDWTHYVHALDGTTMAIEDGPLERVDRQSLAMVEDARNRLSERGYPVADGIMLNGFSASGNFVDRFAVLHPDRVQSVTAGGINGMALLPLHEADGHTLDFHVGIADVESLTGEPVDLAALDGVDQFLYMGAEDTNDTIPYDDAWTDDDLRETALAVYGEDMVSERFPRSQEAYREADVEAQFRVYDGVGHSPGPAFEDLVEFHRRSMAGEDVADFGQELVGSARFALRPESPSAGDEIEFDASASEGGVNEISRYLWDFGDDETAVGETVTHAFDEPGEHAVTLTLVYDSGTEAEITEEITVSAADGTAAETDANDSSSAGTDAVDEETESTGEGGPGFGVASSLAGFGGVGYLLKRRFTDEDADGR